MSIAPNGDGSEWVAETPLVGAKVGQKRWSVSVLIKYHSAAGSP